MNLWYVKFEHLVYHLSVLIKLQLSLYELGFDKEIVIELLSLKASTISTHKIDNPKMSITYCKVEFNAEVKILFNTYRFSTQVHKSLGFGKKNWCITNMAYINKLSNKTSEEPCKK